MASWSASSRSASSASCSSLPSRAPRPRSAKSCSTAPRASPRGRSACPARRSRRQARSAPAATGRSRSCTASTGSAPTWRPGRPLCIVVDDAQWADVPSLRFLAFLLPRLEELPVALVVGARGLESGDSSELLETIVGDSSAEVVLLQPLSPAGVSDFVEQALGLAPGPAFVDACLRTTRGIPFLLRELATALRAEGLEPTESAADDVDRVGAPAIGRSIALRLGRLPEPAVGLAHALAILERGELHEAAEPRGPSDRPGGGGGRRARHGGHRRARRGRWRSSTRSCGRASTSHSRRTPARATTGRRRSCSQSVPGENERVAEHLLAAEPVGDRWSVERLVDAARTASRTGAPESAAVYLRRALAEPPDSGRAARRSPRARRGRGNGRAALLARPPRGGRRDDSGRRGPRRRGDRARPRAQPRAASGRRGRRALPHRGLPRPGRRGAIRSAGGARHGSGGVERRPGAGDRRIAAAAESDPRAGGCRGVRRARGLCGGGVHRDAGERAGRRLRRARPPRAPRRTCQAPRRARPALVRARDVVRVERRHAARDRALRRGAAAPRRVDSAGALGRRQFQDGGRPRPPGLAPSPPGRSRGGPDGHADRRGRLGAPPADPLPAAERRRARDGSRRPGRAGRGREGARSAQERGGERLARGRRSPVQPRPAASRAVAYRRGACRLPGRRPPDDGARRPPVPATCTGGRRRRSPTCCSESRTRRGRSPPRRSSWRGRSGGNARSASRCARRESSRAVLPARSSCGRRSQRTSRPV